MFMIFLWCTAPCISAFFPEWIGCSQWPTSQRNELLNSDCCFIQCTVNRRVRRRMRGGAYSYRPFLLDARVHPSSSLATRAVALGLLSPLPAPFGVHAHEDQARNRLETVWSLSEIDKIENGVLDICVHLQWSCLLENGISALFLERLRPPVATLRQYIYIYFFFPR